MMLEYEYEHLQSLSNLQWLMYPFVKTLQVWSKNLHSLCNKPSKEDISSNVDPREMERELQKLKKLKKMD